VIIEINYLTVVIIGALLSAFVGALWAIGRTFLQQYGTLVSSQLEAVQDAEAKAAEEIKDRLDRLEADHSARILDMSRQISDLEDVSAKALTHKDLDDLYGKINATSGDVREMKGELRLISTSLQMILNRIAERGMT
jgi:hypothetical protein